MTIRRTMVSTVVAVTVLAACATTTMHVRSAADPDTDLRSLATYAWSTAPLRNGAPETAGELFDYRVRTAVDAELAAKGYARAASTPDMVVSYRVSTRERELTDTLGQYAQYRAAGGTESAGDAWVSGYEEGSLRLEVRDPRGTRLLWWGSATAVVNPALREKRIPEAVRQMLASFPRRP